MIERVAVDAGDKNIFVAVVVIIANGHAHVVAGARQSGFVGDVGEVSLAVVFKKTVAIFRGTLAERMDVGAVSEKNVELAVVVVIEDGHASGHGFGSMALGRFVGFELEIDGLVGEADGAIRTGLSRRCEGFRRRLRMQSRLRHQ